MPVPSRQGALAVGAATLLACTKPNPAFQEETGSSGAEATTAPVTTAPVTTDMSPETGSSGVTPTTSGSGSSDGTSTTGAVDPTTGTSSTGDTSTSTGDDTSSSSTGTTGEPGAPATCAEARAQGGVTSGVYTLLVPESGGATVDVWCEQELADGGWLLVARSTATAMPPSFGWGIGTGDIADDADPYALNLLALKFPASEVLLGAHDGAKAPGEPTYRLKAPAGFPFGFDLAAGATSEITTVLGDCEPEGGPTALRWLGFTKLSDRLRLRDSAEGGADDVHGLFASGFATPGDCPNGGELNGAQGLIFVR